MFHLQLLVDFLDWKKRSLNSSKTNRKWNVQCYCFDDNYCTHAGKKHGEKPVKKYLSTRTIIQWDLLFFIPPPLKQFSSLESIWSILQIKTLLNRRRYSILVFMSKTRITDDFSTWDRELKSYYDNGKKQIDHISEALRCFKYFNFVISLHFNNYM